MRQNKAIQTLPGRARLDGAKIRAAKDFRKLLCRFLDNDANSLPVAGQSWRHERRSGRVMQKIAFVASFLAVFVTADVELFDGAVTRYSYHFATGVAQDARNIQTQVTTWFRRH